MPSELILAVQSRIAVPPVAPLTEADITEAEANLGFALPALLRELYVYIGNGGFGPGHGLLSLKNIGNGERSIVELYLEMRQDYPGDPTWKWPEGVLAICDWGCNIYSCVVCNKPLNPVLTFEYMQGPMEHSFLQTRDSLESWLRDWLAGVEVFESLYEAAPEFDIVGKNPKTGEPMLLKGRKPKRRQ